MTYTPSPPYENGPVPAAAQETGLHSAQAATGGLGTRSIAHTGCFACLSGLLWLATCAHAADRLDLEGTTITGSQELPKALHIVPWKPAEAGELAARPMNSLVDEILAPIDRDVFLRELEYYEAVHSSK